MSLPTVGKDWHFNFQDEDYLNLSLQRLEEATEPLHWCVQFGEIMSHHFESPIESLSINDIGCNVGHFCRVLDRFPHEVAYHGYDISETYLSIARHRFPQFSFSMLDIAIEQPKQLANVSIVSATLEHVEAWEEAFFNILETTSKLILLRSFFGTEEKTDMYNKARAMHPYLIRQFTFLQIAEAAERKGFRTTFIRDRATDSVPQYLGCNVTRTQYIAVLRNTRES